MEQNIDVYRDGEKISYGEIEDNEICWLVTNPYEAVCRWELDNDSNVTGLIGKAISEGTNKVSAFGGIYTWRIY